METTVGCQFAFGFATTRKTAMEMSYDGTPGKISCVLSFIQSLVHWGSLWAEAHAVTTLDRLWPPEHSDQAE